MTQENHFVSVPFLFAGEEEMQLTIFSSHVRVRCKERLGISFADDSDCCRFLVEILSDNRLALILDKVPLYSKLAIYVEDYNIYLFMQIGTKVNSQEVKVSTIYVRSEKQERVLVDEQDLCYVLPKEGSLRFGKEKKHFALKKKHRKAHKKKNSEDLFPGVFLLKKWL